MLQGHRSTQTAHCGFGGGGSGLVLHQAIQMLGGGGNDEFVVKVGSGGNYGKAGKDTTPAYFRAQGGASGDGVRGGAGYSGGAGGGACFF